MSLLRPRLPLFSPSSLSLRWASSASAPSARKQRHLANKAKYNARISKGDDLPLFQSLMRKLYLRG
jgi:hypothetical protein